jgi:hypothetical protein
VGLEFFKPPQAPLKLTCHRTVAKMLGTRDQFAPVLRSGRVVLELELGPDLHAAHSAPKAGLTDALQEDLFTPDCSAGRTPLGDVVAK